VTPLLVIASYLVLLLSLGLLSKHFFRGTSRDFFIASQTIGPFLLLMSVFGTTMTGFALVGSTGKAFERGIGVYGLMASWSGLIHAAIFFLVGIRLWTYGKRHGYVTQIQFFRDRFESNGLGYLLFPILVGLVLPYLLIGVLAAGKFVLPVTAGAFPSIFPNEATPRWAGGIPVWLTGLVVSGVVLTYVFGGGSRGTVWANTFQTLVFMAMGVLAFTLIAGTMGGLDNASKIGMQIDAEGRAIQTHGIDRETHELIEYEKPRVLGRVAEPLTDEQKARIEADGPLRPHQTRTVIDVEFDERDPETKEIKGTFHREFGIPPWMFLSYMFIPLSVGMFPHLFQNWLTARSARTFRMTVIAHPIFIMIVWLPCVLIGVWASGVIPALTPDKISSTLGIMVANMTHNDLIVGLVAAGVLAAIMSSLDSQFLCLGTIFTNDIVLHIAGKERFTDRQVVLMARSFIVAIVILVYLLAMWADAAGAGVFDLAVWCFSGFGALFPLVFASIYWKRVTKAGAYSSVIAAMVVWFWYFRESGYGGEYTIGPGIMPAALAFGAGAIALTLVSLVTKAPSAETLAKFFPEDESVQVEAPGDGDGKNL
jgi:SSS family solute:Na+ symporter